MLSLPRNHKSPQCLRLDSMCKLKCSVCWIWWGTTLLLRCSWNVFMRIKAASTLVNLCEMLLVWVKLTWMISLYKFYAGTFQVSATYLDHPWKSTCYSFKTVHFKLANWASEWLEKSFQPGYCSCLPKSCPSGNWLLSRHLVDTIWKFHGVNLDMQIEWNSPINLTFIFLKTKSYT